MNANVCFAQYYYPEPETPFTGEFSKKRVLADTIIISTKEYNVEENVIVDPVFDIIIKHHENGLTDSIKIQSGSAYFEIRNYSSSGQLTSILGGDYESTPDIFYTYTTDNRIESIECDNIRAETRRYDYEKNIIIRNENRIYRDTLFIEYTETGYTVKEKKKETSYILDEMGRVIQAGNISYQYIKDGYIMVNGDTKEVYELNEDGFLIKRSTYKLEEQKWIIKEIMDVSYKNTIPNSVITYEPESVSIHAIRNGIKIKDGQNNVATIYSIQGKIVYSDIIKSSYEKIYLQSGVYIVSIKGKSHKVMVK